MAGFLLKSRSIPSLSEFSLNTYKIGFSLDRLGPGVDNVRHDVFLSSTFVNATRKIVTRLLTRHAGIEKKDHTKRRSNWAKEVDTYKQLYKELMSNAVNQAKGRRERQIEYLAQAALIKMLLEETRTQFDDLIGRIKKTVRNVDLAEHNDLAASPRLKGELQSILQNRESILLRVGQEICSYWAEVEQKDILPMHEAVFGQRTPFYLHVLENPILHLDQVDNEFFRITEYDVTLGRRIDDPDKYETLLYFLRQMVNELDMNDSSSHSISVDQRLSVPPLQEDEGETRQAYNQKIEGWLQYLGNMDVLLNWQRTKAELATLKKNKADDDAVDRCKVLMWHQKKALHYVYRKFCKNGLMDRISASYEMQPEYLEYCPPLSPQQIAQYLLSPKNRKVIRSRLKRLQKLYGKTFSLRPLNKKIKTMEQMTVTKRKAYLIRFLTAFTRYHRDMSNYLLFREAMERIRLATEEKIIALSRENNTLNEFLLSHEQVSTKAPIINHVVIKADVRGSTDITHLMNGRGLNPASYFSLNFFDPISEILAEYEANKIFIEGDAIILSIFEREGSPAGWYSVARACGIALNMLVIIRHYNENNKKNQLPVLELGIGVSHLKKAPTFLFDGDNRIMISPAINQADRLSSCSKTGRRMLARQKGPFNLYVFQTLSDEVMAATKDDLLTRYNVNGIELNAKGFEKLSQEIDLKLLQTDLIEQQEPKSILYTGKFPTKSGRFQRLIIRESQVPVVDPNTLKILRVSSRKYYEVCTNPKLYKLARQHRG